MYTYKYKNGRTCINTKMAVHVDICINTQPLHCCYRDKCYRNLIGLSFHKEALLLELHDEI